QLELLKSLNCDEGQGFLFSKSLSAEDFIKYAKGNVLHSDYQTTETEIVA
ncbi:MAG: hypothetical protein HQL03_15205, partial [Nitrospirae bacterium]|nr:hypothetical protein [Nitrospirota bacterium]